MNRRRSLLSVSKISVPDDYFYVNAYTNNLGSVNGGIFKDTELPYEFTVDFSSLKNNCSIERLFSTTQGFIYTPVIINFIGDTSKLNNYNLVFLRRPGIEEINGVLDFSNSTKNDRPFLDCSKLKKITIAKNSIHTNFDISSTAVLSNESVQSVVDGLADITGSASYTVTFNAKQPITRAQADSISAKGWTLSGGSIS